MQISTFLTGLLFAVTLCMPCVGVGAPVSPPQNVTRQDLVSIKETLERAYMQNTDLDEERAKLRQTDEALSQANADWRPSLSVTGTQQQTQNYIARHGRPNERQHGSLTQHQVSLTQNLYRGGATEAGIDEAESNVSAGRATLYFQEQKSLFQGVQDHTSIVAQTDIVTYNQQNVEFYKKLLDRATGVFEVGIQSRTEVSTAEAKYEQAQADLSEALGNLETAKATYTQNEGAPPGNLAPATILEDLPKVYDEALEIAKANNPAIKAARYQLEAAEHDVKVQFAPLLPQLGVEGDVGNTRRTGTEHPRHPRTTDLTFTATLTVPLYQQGIPNSKVRAAYQKVGQLKVALVAARRGVVQQIKSAWETLIANREAVKGYIAFVKSQELAIEGTLEQFYVGLKSAIDVVELQTELVKTQIQLATAQQNLVQASYSVMQAMGRLTACDLGLNVKYYDPNVYYNEYSEAWIALHPEDMRYVKDEQDEADVNDEDAQ